MNQVDPRIYIEPVFSIDQDDIEKVSKIKTRCFEEVSTAKTSSMYWGGIEKTESWENWLDVLW